MMAPTLTQTVHAKLNNFLNNRKKTSSITENQMNQVGRGRITQPQTKTSSMKKQ